MKIRISFLLGLSLLLIATSAHTQAAPQTWVSGVGDDTNPCTRTAPCLTFAHAILVTDPGGEISVLDPGDFGPVVITKSITINGGSTLAGVFAAFSNGVIVNVITPGDPGVVILRGLSINGVGTGLNGIRYLVGAKLVIEQCNVYGFTQNDIEVSQVGPKNLVVKNTTLTNGAAGIHLADTTGADTLVQVTNSLIVGNTGYGVHAEGKGTISVANSLLANNGVAVRAETLATVRLSNNDIFDNGTGIGCGAGGGGASGTVASAHNNKKAPNGPCRPNDHITVQ
jgi:parallel beta helix pectate lyase-like protein